MQRRPDDFIRAVEAVYASTTRAQRKFAEWLLANSSTVLELTIEEAAEAAQVSRSTILRFCNLLQVDGYRGLRGLVAGSISRQARRTDGDAVVNWLIGVTEETFRDTFISFDLDTFNEAVEICTKARNIIWFGQVESGALAQCASHKCSLLGMDSRVFVDVATFAVQSGLINSEDALVVISWGGDGDHVRRVTTTALKKGIPIIAITVSRFSWLAKTATTALVAGGKFATHEERELTVRAGQEALLNALILKTATARHIHWRAL
jgi:DNA-binding MurR/RpiR family transcriptional regulator